MGLGPGNKKPRRFEPAGLYLNKLVASLTKVGDMMAST
jgi:hypothetical protein